MKGDCKAYELDWDISRLKKSDVKFDGFLMPFKDYKITKHLMRITEYQLPDKVYVEAFPDFLTQTDYPMINFYWPIMSKQMYDILVMCGSFNHTAIPITMINAEVLSTDRFDRKGNLKTSAINSDYIGIQLTSYTDIFDYEKSIYDPHEIYPDKVGFIKKLVLKTEADKIPPIFRLKECKARIFISSYIKETFEKVGIKGVVYKSIE